jgi:hypothetical protein
VEALAIGFGILQLGAGLFGSSKQKRVDKAAAELTFRSNKEEIRRREFEQEQIMGATKALSENAGVRHTLGSSAQGYIDTMAEQFGREIAYMKEYADTARKLGLKEAQLRAQTGAFNAIGSGLQTYGMLRG